MEFKQSTLGEILESEKEMVLRGEELYGEFFINAQQCNNLLWHFIKTIDDTEKFFFPLFFSQVRKHHTLALLSSVRLHHIQTSMNLRQVLEASSWAAYAMAFSEEGRFCKRDATKIVKAEKSLSDKCYKWFETNFKVHSDRIQSAKKMINHSTAHSNVIYTFLNFKTKPINDPGFNLSYFDFHDEFHVHSSLFQIANIALAVLSLFSKVNQKYTIFTHIDAYAEQYDVLMSKNLSLRKQAMQSERFIQVTKFKS